MDMGRSIWFGEARNGAKKGSESVLTQDGKYIGVGVGWCGLGGGVRKVQRLGLG